MSYMNFLVTIMFRNLEILLKLPTPNQCHKYYSKDKYCELHEEKMYMSRISENAWHREDVREIFFTE